MLSEEVVVARSASGQASASVWCSVDLVSWSSTIASTTRSQPASSVGSVVTLSFEASPPSSLRQSLSTVSSALQADVSLRASSFTSPRVVAAAASPAAIAPLPATAGLSVAVWRGFSSH